MITIKIVALKTVFFCLYVQLCIQPCYFYALDRDSPQNIERHELIEFECSAGESWIKKVFDGCMSTWSDMQLCLDNRDAGSKKLATMFDGIIGKLVYVNYVFTSAQKKKYNSNNSNKSNKKYNYKLLRNDMLYLNRIIECMILLCPELPLCSLDSGYRDCLKEALVSLRDMCTKSSVQNIV